MTKHEEGVHPVTTTTVEKSSLSSFGGEGWGEEVRCFNHNGITPDSPMARTPLPGSPRTGVGERASAMVVVVALPPV